MSHDVVNPLGQAEHFVLGLAFATMLAGLLARALRRAGLHWTWALAAGLPCALIAKALGVPGLPLILAIGLATTRGRRWHRMDLDLGGQEARLARARRSAIDQSLCWARRAVERVRAGERAHVGATEVQIGRREDGRDARLPFRPGLGAHILVLGATGAGKTVTQALIASRAIEAGCAVIAVDPKGDRALREQLCSSARAARRGFREWTPAGPCLYNPYSHGSDTQIADRLLAGERFTEPHYLRQAQRYMGHAVRAMRELGEEVSLSSITRMLDAGAFELKARALPEHAREEVYDYLASLTQRQLRDLSGVRDRLAILAESDVGPWLEPAKDEIDLAVEIRRGAVVYFNLESDSRPLMAKMLGAAIVQDLQSTVAAMQHAPAPALVAIDEFSALGAEHVVALFGRARSAGMTLLLGTQELSDLRPPGNERLLEQILGNLSVVIAHRQVVPASTQLLSQLAGSRPAWRVSWGSDGRSTRTRTQEPRLAPEVLTGLGPGAALVLPLAEPSEASVVRVEAPGRRA